MNIHDRIVDEFVPIYFKDIPNDLSEIVKYSDEQVDSDVVLSVKAAAAPALALSPSEFLEKVQSIDEKLIALLEPPAQGENPSIKDSVFLFFNLCRDLQRLRFLKAWLLRFAVWAKENKRYLTISHWYDLLWQMRRFLAEKPDYVCVLGNAMLKSKNGLHPLFGRSVILDLTTEENPVISLRLCGEEEGALFYGDLLKVKSNSTRVNTNACNNLTSHLPYVHPLCRSSLGDTFRKFIAEFSSGGFWEESAENASRRDLPYVLYYEPVIFLQKRESGIKQSLDKFRHALNNGMTIPAHVTDILLGHEELPTNGENPDSRVRDRSGVSMNVMSEDSPVLSDQSAADDDVLWVLPANKEQMKIAQKARKNNGVVVQGPPGTGKTHMIVNLLGHFLSLGKRVLVVGQKAKALSVIQDKLDPKFCGLCVSAVQDGGIGPFTTEVGLMTLLSDAEESSIEQLRCLEKVEGDIRQVLSKELQETRKKCIVFVKGSEKALLYEGSYNLFQYWALG